MAKELRKDRERKANSDAIRTGRQVNNGRGFEVSMNMYASQSQGDTKYPPGKPGGKANG